MRYLAVILICFLLLSCATIPKQAPMLSEELGKQISLLEKSHISLLQSYFDQKRALIDNFIKNTWIPTFTEEFFSNDQVNSALNEVIKSGTAKDKLEFFTKVSTELQIVINEKQLELFAPLNELQKSLEIRLQEEYSLAKSANSTITNFLSTASKLDENRQRYLNKIGLTEDKLSEYLNKTDDILSDLVKKSDGLPDKIDDYKKKYDQYLKEIKDLKTKISN